MNSHSFEIHNQLLKILKHQGAANKALELTGVDLELDLTSFVDWKIKELKSQEFRRYYNKNKVRGYSARKAYELMTGKDYESRFFLFFNSIALLIIIITESVIWAISNQKIKSLFGFILFVLTCLTFYYTFFN